MNIQFENKYYGTDAMLSEYVRKVLCAKLVAWGGIFFIISFVMFVSAILSGNYIRMTLFGVSGFILLFVVVVSPFLMIKQLKDSTNRLHNNKDVETVVQFGDNISMTEGTFSLTIEYSQIQVVYELKHSYVMMFGKQNGIMISPSGFTQGSFEDFKTFIKLKAPQAIFKQKCN